MSVLKYNGYEGTAEIDMESLVCRGKILFVDDLVTYQAANPASLQKEFEAAVDDYLETCEHLGRNPRKPLKGQFNVRVSPSLHKQAAIRAIEEGTSLNKVVAKSLEFYLGGSPEVNQHITINMERPPDGFQTFAASSSTESKWEGSRHVH
ncbi:MAG: type II toxin-antitoxin system HicB family antitoxin [Thermodesulfobacteriota bacterium]|nr:type II toxin-antitoxin system HicB family antitoxin [Thermodesulfobacteriota bacterium]